MKKLFLFRQYHSLLKMADIAGYAYGLTVFAGGLVGFIKGKLLILLIMPFTFAHSKTNSEKHNVSFSW